MSEILSQQKQNLIYTIGEAKKKEYQRLKRLQNVASKSEKNMLVTRFERERLADQVKIQQLSSDLTVLTDKVKSGDLQQVKEYRDGKTVAERAMGEVNKHNRFAGLEDYNHVIFHADVVSKFEKHDKRFAQKQSRIAFDPIEEQRKLHLLDSKRVLLKQLITIQAAEMNANGQHVTASGRNLGTARINQTSRSNHGGSHVNYETCSNATSRTTASYATFASHHSSNSNNNQLLRSNNSGRRLVPPLALSRIAES